MFVITAKAGDKPGWAPVTGIFASENGEIYIATGDSLGQIPPIVEDELMELDS